MKVKQYNGRVFGASLSAKERAAMRLEIGRQITEANRTYVNNVDAMVLWTLHIHLGFGKKRLRRFWEAFRTVHDELTDYYQMPNDDPWLCMTLLKRIGVDVEKWNGEEKNDENRF